jgi:glutamyl-tRNA synthetase
MAEELGVKVGILTNGIRAVVTGQLAGPGLFDVLVAVGQNRVVERLRKAVELFE